MEDISDILAFELKKEIADRYFGFRKQIETDTCNYKERIGLYAIEHENSIGYALLRTYVILQDARLISDFLRLAGLPADLYFDPYILSSPTIRLRIFSGVKIRGITRRGRFFNLFYDCYKELEAAIAKYNQAIEQLAEEQEVIRAEIDLFYRNNDIDSIMGFMRRMEAPAHHNSDMLQYGSAIEQQQKLSAKLKINPPLPPEQLLPPVSQPPPFIEIKLELKDLAARALSLNPEIEVRQMLLPL